MNCPVCTHDLSDTTYEGSLVHTCAAGHGAFLTTDSVGAIMASRADDQSDSDESAAIAAQGPKAIREITETPRSCPECGTEMAKLNFAYESGVIVDSCSAHGLWVDAGELDRMQAWVEGSEKLHDKEAAEWHGKLDEIEHKFDEDNARGNRLSKRGGDGEAYDGLGFLVQKVSLWWYRRDDHSRR
ncbi:MAG: zf-TFIIB domain-containing protein [Thermoleophilia bacterium]|nr:zf-TFIIB domain-containing protein [Thermoleophilia bacterium]